MKNIFLKKTNLITTLACPGKGREIRLTLKIFLRIYKRSSLAFVAPETLEKHPMSIKDASYSIGSILYSLLYGKQ